MLLTLIDRSPRQDAIAAVNSEAGGGTNGYNPKTFKTLFENKSMKGVQYREVKPGVGAKATLTVNWSEKKMRAWNVTDGVKPTAAANTGKFYSAKSNTLSSLWDTTATSPPVKDFALINIIPFDEVDTNRDLRYVQRYMVSVNIDYMVLVTDKKVQTRQ